ncbi:Glycerol-3-phosphate dehydrogenase [NAD(P)+] [Paraliobacillus sp. PM-2]|uniref:NAD(P)H-dependent glycerol-3-phosphate dehydrogenase n=1 Tax=Paraliobacillus sp. PM-2 TaxID=1462524 RepID=UPI00061C60B4|nr:NAD(P)H-dependent glycerol-3-phosphate dehydrogenase [Paraliobacillus sp. PM-2]CQR46700.1 Glycerol-3-phosphate dehydrogenase [NAD(P)+] [Paraliobacillus sp. PM-2]
MEKIAVLGAGSWGTALAMVLKDNGHDVRLWTHNQSHADEINQTHANKDYLPNITLPKDLKAYTSLKEVLQDVSTIVFVLPTEAIREVCQKVSEVLDHHVTIIHGTKGIEPKSLKRVSEMMEEELPRQWYTDIVVLSGPSHAEEVSLRHPTTVTVSSRTMTEAEKAQDLFINEHFRVYTSADMIGVELGGSLKNIIALGAGITDGLGYGDNAKAALVTRGLAEIARLGTTKGADPLTFVGLSGVGDLIVTCTSVHSRNWKAGNLLAKGKRLDDVLQEMGMVVEGVRTTKAAYELAQIENIEMPITNGLYKVLFEGANPKDVVDQLMKRMRRHEMEDISNVLSNRYKL